jgi:hypothetical protein
LTSRGENANDIVFRNYFDSPRVQIAELSAAANKLAIGLDLRRDVARTLVTGLPPDLTFATQVWRGVVDGTLERYLIEFLSSSPDGDGNRQLGLSTSSLFESARARNTPAVLFMQNGTKPGSALSADTRARIDESIAAGHVLVAPQQPAVIGGAKRYAWWQINPRSGETIAVADDGRRAATADVVITTQAGATGAIAVQVTVQGGGTFFTVLSSPTAVGAYVSGVQALPGVGLVIWTILG